MESVRIDRQRGQILVQVALMAVALFAFVALAVDGGQIYGGRRRMQNAADAGALAGAREICFGSPDQAETAALNYAVERNNAQTATVQILDGYTVTVDARQTLDTFFAGVIGIGTAGVRAEAAAACGKVTTVCNVWPLGFDETTFGEIEQCPQRVLLWEDGRADCETYRCNCDPDPDSDDLLIVGDGRAWIDFSAVTPAGYDDPCDGPGCGTSELRARIVGQTNQGGDCLSYIELPSCTPGDSGVRNSAWSDAGDQTDQIKFIPLYDQRGCELDEETAPGDQCGSGDETFSLTTVMCVRIVTACRLCEEGTAPPCPSGPRVIEVEILCPEDAGCSDACGTTFGGAPGPGDVKAVNLVAYP